MKARITLIAALLIIAPAVAQQTLLVPSNYATIQGAINAAVNGDTVLVGPGTYFERINLNGKNITVASTSGPAATIIDAQQLGPVVTFSNGETRSAVLSGFTVKNGLGTWNGTCGGGIVCAAGSNPTINRCIVTANTAQNTGGGIYSLHSNPLIQNCVIAQNIAARFGGGIGCDGSFPQIVACVVVGNSATGSIPNGGYGGGIWIDQMGASIRNCTISGNYALYDGSGMKTFGASVAIVNSIFWSDVSTEISFVGTGPTLTNCNVAAGWSGPGSDNIDANPQFVDPANGDFHILPTSPSVDAGDATRAGLPDFDLDGNPRMMGATVDIGAYEAPGVPSLGPIGAGNVGAGIGGPFDVLLVNGSAGVAPARTVNVPLFAPITIAMLQPPTNAQPANFVIALMLDIPSPADAYDLPAGIGTLSFSSPHLNPGVPGIFVLTNNYGPDPLAMAGSSPTPWSETYAGLPVPFAFSMQGVIDETPGVPRVTNCVVVDVQ